MTARIAATRRRPARLAAVLTLGLCLSVSARTTARVETAFFLERISVVDVGFRENASTAAFVGWWEVIDPHTRMPRHQVRAALVNAKTGAVLNAYSLPIYIDLTSRVFLSNRGTLFAAMLDHREIGVWRVDDGVKVAGIRAVRPPGSLMFSPNDDELWVDDQRWRLSDGESLGEDPDLIARYRWGWASRPALSSDGHLKVEVLVVHDPITRNSTRVELRRANDNQLVHRLDIDENPHTVRAKFSPDGRLIALTAYAFEAQGDGRTTIMFWDTVTGRVTQQITDTTFCHFKAWHPDSIRAVMTCMVFLKGEQVRVYRAR